jgi:hypothetical protein
MQMSELMRLLLKAVRSLPQDEQDVVLTELLGAKVAGGGPEQRPEHLLGFGREWAQLTGVELGPPLQLSPALVKSVAGGPWQTVPVRLSVEHYERLKQWCQANGFTMAVVVRGLVARFLDEQARRPRPGGGEAGEVSA